MSNKKKKIKTAEDTSDKHTLTEAGKRKLYDLLIIIVITVLLLGLYYYFVQTWHFESAFLVAIGLWSVSFVAYWVYNRGFTRKNVTPEMLPDEWSDEKKRQFIDDGKRRLEKSKWLIYIIVPLCFLFITEIVITILLPALSGFADGFGA